MCQAKRENRRTDGNSVDLKCRWHTICRRTHNEHGNFLYICKLPVSEIAADNCVLFMWATYPMLPEALKLIDEWGFKYKTIGFQWIKLNKSGKGKFFGLGRWTRGNTEPCLIAIKGKPKRINSSISQIIEYPIAEHSKKPGIVRKKIVSLVGDLPRIELFARQTPTGWDYWGNECNPIGGGYFGRLRRWFRRLFTDKHI